MGRHAQATELGATHCSDRLSAPPSPLPRHLASSRAKTTSSSMAALGHSRQFDGLRHTSATPPIAPGKRTWRQESYGPIGDMNPHHSITSSARSRNASGILSAIALAALRLTTSRYFVGNWTGSSLTLAPLSLRRKKSSKGPCAARSPRRPHRQGDRRFARAVGVARFLGRVLVPRTLTRLTSALLDPSKGEFVSAGRSG